MAPKKETFDRTLGLWSGLGLAVSFVVGSGLLGLPGIVLESIGPRYSALSWILTSAAMIPLVIVFSRLGVLFPASPGLLAYAEAAFGRAGRNSASLMLLVSFLLGMPALMMIAGSYIQVLFGAPAHTVPLLALLVLSISVGLNLLGLKTTSRFNTVSVLALILFIILLAVVKAAYFQNGIRITSRAITDLLHLRDLQSAPLWRGCTLIFWAFLGWESLSFGVQEFKNPKRNVPLIFGGSFIIVTLIYWGLAFTSIGALVAGVHTVKSPSGVIAILDGSGWEPICLPVIVLLIMGNTNSWVYSASRFFVAEASTGILPRQLSRLTAKGIPARCLILIYVLIFSFTALWSRNGLSIADLILLVNQNFIFLFLASIFAYLIYDKSRWRFVVSPIALMTCSLFLSGFSVWVGLPFALIIIGVGITFLKK